MSKHVPHSGTWEFVRREICGQETPKRSARINPDSLDFIIAERFAHTLGPRIAQRV